MVVRDRLTLSRKFNLFPEYSNLVGEGCGVVETQAPIVRAQRDGWNRQAAGYQDSGGRQEP